MTRSSSKPIFFAFFVRCLSALLPAVGLPAVALAQDIGARAFLSAPQVGVGRQFVLSVEVSGTQQLDALPVLPDMEDFAGFLSMSTSTSVRIVNGRTSLSITHRYHFQALTEGTFEIGAVRVTLGDRTVQTEPVTLVVSDAPPPSRPSAGPGTDAPGTDDSLEDLFIETDVSKARVFENEPIAVEYRIFTRVPVETYTITALPQATGFWSEELEQPTSPRTEQVSRNGSRYLAATVRRMILFPTGSGSRTLDPMSIEAQVRVRDRNIFDAFADIFDFSSILDRRVPMVVTSRPVTIEVLPLPAEGRPGSFAGHVGTLGVSASLNRTEVETNEAVTFRVEYSGTGNLRTLSPPGIEFPVEFDAFPAETTDRVREGGGSLQGTRTYEYVLIARAPGELTIPPVEVSYFDPASGRYGSARSSPLEITVTGDGSFGEGTGAVPTAVETLREEIRFIRTGTPHFRRTGVSLFETGGFWVVLLLPLVSAGGALLLRRHRDRLEGDVAYARARRADRMAKKRLAKARGSASGDPREFYAEVAGAIEGMLADRLNIAEAGLVREHAGRIAAGRGVSPETLARLFACLDDCDRQRFTPVGADREPPERILGRAAAIMADLARELSK